MKKQQYNALWGRVGLTGLLLASSAAYADISGKVFRDFNGNGVFDSGAGLNEVGAAGVTVKAFDSAGVETATATSAADGTYTLTGLSAGADYRVEFSWAESWLKPGAAGGTSVQFAKDGASNIDLAVQNPKQTFAAGEQATIATAIFSGSVNFGDGFVVTKVPESAGSADNPATMGAYMTPAPTVLATEAQVGAVRGVAHDRQRQRLLVGAFVKRFTRLGGNPTTIYSVPENGGTPSAWVTLDPTRADPHGANPQWDKDFDVIPYAGKEGLGDVDISEDGRTVYTIDLKTRELVSIPVNPDGSAGTPQRTALPTTFASCADSNDVRPLGLGVHEGKVYVGSVCSAESTVSGLPIAGDAARKGDPSKLRAYVHVWDGASTFNPVLDFALSYPRGCLNAGGMGNCSTFGNAAWQAWTPIYPFSSWDTFGNGYPQPALTDIEFLPNGDMVLGFADRFGFMDGSYAAEPWGGNSQQLTIAGDTLHACRTGQGTWVMETLISGDAGCKTVGKGYDAAQQKTLDEYYFADDIGENTAKGNHAELGEGGLGILLHNSNVLSSVMDPPRYAPWDSDGKDPWETHGLHWYDSKTGDFKKGYVHVDQGQPGDQPVWGKGNGMGDVEVLYAASPIEIGNRVWSDANGNGIQDAGEAGIDGVEVALTCGSDVATTSTSNDGQFLFSNKAGGNATFMNYGEDCELAIAASQGALSGLQLTTANADSKTNNDAVQDVRDSDATTESGKAVIRFKSGNMGENNHGLDVGYKSGTSTPAFIPPAGPTAMSCTADTRLATAIHVNGDSQATGSTGANVNSLVTFDYASSGVLSSPFSKASAGQTGAIWGLAYDSQRKKLYAAAFLKRHASFGAGGIGAIYQMDATAANATPSLLIDLAANSVDLGTDPRDPAGKAPYEVSDPNDASPNKLPADATKPSWDRDAFALVGKISIGDIDTSPDGNTLWAVNLKQRELVQIDVANKTVTAKHAIPDPGCSNGDYRPWAVKVHDGKVWVGTVCSAETSQQAADLKAYVQAFDGITFTTATSFALDYPRGNVGNGPGKEKWQPWTSTYKTLATNPSFAIYPQPILADIEFDVDGSLILGFIDRMGHQVGGANFTPNYPDWNTMIQGQSGGDIIRVCNNNGTYALENNGTCSSGSTAGKDNTQGNGNGEYYWGEMWDYNPWNTNGGFHQETSFGGLAFKAGSGEVVLSAMNPLTAASSGGLLWLDNTTGGRSANQGLQLYTGNETSSYFGKASGMGDVEVFCAESAAPVTHSLGNRVWIDLNNNGKADSGENHAGDGIKLELRDNKGTKLADTTTDTNGRYLFHGLAAGEYQVCVTADNFAAGSKLAKYRSSTGQADADSNSEDGVDRGDDDLADGACSTVTVLNDQEPLKEYGFTDQQDGDDGKGTPDANSNLTVDFGFVPPTDIELTKTVDKTSIKPGEEVTYTLTVTNKSAVVATGVKVSEQLPPRTTLVTNGATASQGTFSGTEWDVGTLPANGSATLLLKVKVD